MTQKEKEIRAYMEKLEISREEAEQLWEDDNSDFESEEMKEMADKAKKNGLLKTGARQTVDPNGKKRVRERKPNEDKRLLVDCLLDALKDFDNAVVVNPERQVDFHLNGVHYSVTLTAHRPPKDKGKA
jgi:hypothetical protein